MKLEVVTAEQIMTTTFNSSTQTCTMASTLFNLMSSSLWLVAQRNLAEWSVKLRVAKDSDLVREEKRLDSTVEIHDSSGLA